jgi:hypothetical protein
MIHVDPALVAPAAAPAPATAPARALIEGQMAMLTRLAQIGMTIAETCGREAAAAADAGPDAAEPASPRDPGLTFARVARAVRMTIALQSRLAKDLAALDRADEQAERTRRSRRRDSLSGLIEEAARFQIAARRRAGDTRWADEDAIEDEIEQLSAEAYERLLDAEDDDFPDAAFHEAVAGIARDLGLSPDWTARLLATAADPPAHPGGGVVAPRPGAGPAPPPGPDPSPHPDPDSPPPGLAWAPPAAPPQPPP